MYGAVYVNSNLKEDSTFLGVSAIRIDTIIKDTLYVKYRVHGDKFLNQDYIKSRNGTFKSIDSMSFDRFNNKHAASLTLNGKNLVLSWHQPDTMTSYRFEFSYKDNVLFSQSRDVYYAEDGFGLYQD